MDIIFQGLVDVLKPMGFSAVVIGALAFWVFKREALITQIQNDRITEGKESVKALLSNTDALRGLTDALRNKVV